MKWKSYFKDVVLNSVSKSCVLPPPVRRLIFRVFKYRIAKTATIHPLCFFGYGKARLLWAKNRIATINVFLTYLVIS